MKTIILLGIVLTSSLHAAPLQNLSEKLTLSGGDKTKEKLPNEETHLIEPSIEPVNNIKIETEDYVEELDKLKQLHEANKDVSDLNENLEASLKQLHETNHHQKGQEEKATKNAFGKSAEVITEAPTTTKQKEVYENLPLPESMNFDATTATKNAQRRSLKNDVSLNAGSILRQLNGKYSAYDMAQYIFWTGDEEGVAKAVEELIDDGLMSRENAIEFLNDIRLGIDYLENTYSLKHGETKNTVPFARLTPTTTTTESSIDEPSNYYYNYQKFHSFFAPSHKNKIQAYDEETPTLSPAALKALEKIPSLQKLAEIQRFGNKQESTASYDEEGGRSRLADFLYGEYSLEEVIYQLAKTMFTQSLTHGSEESQAALQKLTVFLEREGKHGRISPALQKKVLDVLLAALSDTLSENPDVMEKARHAMIEK